MIAKLMHIFCLGYRLGNMGGYFPNGRPHLAGMDQPKFANLSVFRWVFNADYCRII